jgi:ketosteroid isomerase-like protein
MSEDANRPGSKALLETWADAVRRHDVPTILAHHEPDMVMVMFDLPPPLQCKRIDAYQEAAVTAVNWFRKSVSATRIVSTIQAFLAASM